MYLQIMNEVDLKNVILMFFHVGQMIWLYTKAQILKYSTIPNRDAIIKVHFQLKHTRNMLSQYSAGLRKVLLFY